MRPSLLPPLALLLLPTLARPSSASGTPDGSAPRERNVAIVLYPSVELLDFAGPGEVFSAVPGHAFRVYTVAASHAPVVSQGFVTVTPQYSFGDCPAPDIVVVPGGGVPLGDQQLNGWLVARSKDAELMMSVCNGALIYASAGLLDGLEVTTHASALQSLALLVPTAKVYANRRFVDTGHVLTSAGISAGIDGALHVVERMLGEKVAWQTAQYMEYDWRPDEIARLQAEPGKAPEQIDALRWASSVRQRGVTGALADYRALAQAPDEAKMNAWGYTFLRAGRTDDSIALLQLVQAAFPTSSNASDSLSEALERAGRSEPALATARECLAHLADDPALDDARRALLHNASASRVARLTGKADELLYECPECGGPCDQGYVEGGHCPGCSMQLRRKGSTTAQAGDA